MSLTKSTPHRTTSTKSIIHPKLSRRGASVGLTRLSGDRRTVSTTPQGSATSRARGKRNHGERNPDAVRSHRTRRCTRDATPGCTSRVCGSR
jgi:hypothetical protein